MFQSHRGCLTMVCSVPGLSRALVAQVWDIFCSTPRCPHLWPARRPLSLLWFDYEWEPLLP